MYLYNHECINEKNLHLNNVDTIITTQLSVHKVVIFTFCFYTYLLILKLIFFVYVLRISERFKL